MLEITSQLNCNCKTFFETYAEKPSKEFIPSPGKLETFDYSGFETGVRFETGYKEGDEISVFLRSINCKNHLP
jgi:acetyl/propionyl-CoA carboxylase alpha subunit